MPKPARSGREPSVRSADRRRNEGASPAATRFGTSQSVRQPASRRSELRRFRRRGESQRRLVGRACPARRSSGICRAGATLRAKADSRSDPAGPRAGTGPRPAPKKPFGGCTPASIGSIPRRRFGPWLFRIGVNLGLDWLRSSKGERSPAASIDRTDPTVNRRFELPDPDPRTQADLAQEVQFILATDAGLVPDDPGVARSGGVLLLGSGGDCRTTRGDGAVATGRGAREVPRNLAAPPGRRARGGPGWQIVIWQIRRVTLDVPGFEHAFRSGWAIMPGEPMKTRMPAN